MNTKTSQSDSCSRNPKIDPPNDGNSSRPHRCRFFYHFTIALFLSVAGQLSVLAQKEIRIDATSDATISEANPNTNYGSFTSLVIGDFDGDEWRANLFFDLSDIPAGAVITDASLRLHWATKRTTCLLELSRPVSSWTEGALTWANKPATSNLATYPLSDNGQATVTLNLSTANTAMQYLQSVVDGATNRGFSIRQEPASAGNWHDFRASETDNEPRLTVIYKENPDTDPIVELTLFRISDTDKDPHTNNPGTAKTSFTPGETVRVTLRAKNTGASVPVQTVLNLRNPDNSTIFYDSHSKDENKDFDSPLNKGETDYYSFDVSISLSANSGSYDVLGSIRNQTDFDIVYDTTAPGPGNGFEEDHVIHDAFSVVVDAPLNLEVGAAVFRDGLAVHPIDHYHSAIFWFYDSYADEHRVLQAPGPGELAGPGDWASFLDGDNKFRGARRIKDHPLTAESREKLIYRSRWNEQASYTIFSVASRENTSYQHGDGELRCDSFVQLVYYWVFGEAFAPKLGLQTPLHTFEAANGVDVVAERPRVDASRIIADPMAGTVHLPFDELMSAGSLDPGQTRSITLSGSVFGPYPLNSTNTKLGRKTLYGRQDLFEYGGIRHDANSVNISIPGGFVAGESVTLVVGTQAVDLAGNSLIGDNDNTPGESFVYNFIVPLDPPTPVAASDWTESDHVSITWDEATGATHYHVYRSETADGAKTALGDWQVTTSYNDTTAIHGKTYYYFVVSALGSSGEGESAFSRAEEGTRGLIPPEGFMAEDGVATESVTISWDSAPGALNYAVYRSLSSGGPKIELANLVIGTSYFDTAAEPGVDYHYFVRSAIGSRTSVEYSMPDTGWRALNPPDGLSASDGASSKHVNVEWNPHPHATHYRVYRSLTSMGAKTPVSDWITSTSYQDTSIAPSSHQHYFVTAAVGPTGTKESGFSEPDTGFRNYGYADWFDLYPEVPEDQRSMVDDPDHDGISNLLEYFCASSPIDPADGCSLYDYTLITPTISTVRYRQNHRAADVTGIIQWSLNLRDWHSSGNSAAGITVSIRSERLPEEATEQYDVYKATIECTGGVPSSQFLRLQVRELP